MRLTLHGGDSAPCVNTVLWLEGAGVVVLCDLCCWIAPLSRGFQVCKRMQGFCAMCRLGMAEISSGGAADVLWQRR